MTLYDASGKMIKQFIGNQDAYDVSSLSTGHYTLSVETERGTATFRLLKK
ncbi:MAG: T9SS type A sorting domain-containing protein [Ekhidna sp.]|nr:T9SS type A sorting domain-containing protein [Ekhidna sp.]